MKTIGSAMLMVVLCAAAAFADASLYLYPRVVQKTGGIAFPDIAMIESDAETSARIRGAVLGEELFADGYLDEPEIREALAGIVVGRISIYGTGVRVTAAPKRGPAEALPVAVRKGSPVRFHVVNSGVRVEMAGTAMQDGAVGEVIPVKLKGSAVSRGTVINERVVELAL